MALTLAKTVTAFEDVLFVILAVLLVPFAILLVGAPLALCLRVALEIARRIF
jgi:hypothetical protein